MPIPQPRRGHGRPSKRPARSHIQAGCALGYLQLLPSAGALSPPQQEHDTWAC